jgi:hypothetical protein
MIVPPTGVRVWLANERIKRETISQRRLLHQSKAA